MSVTIRQASVREIEPLFERTIETSWNDLPPALQRRTPRRVLERQIRQLIEQLLKSGPSTFLVAEDEEGRNLGHLWLGEVTEAFSGERRGYIHDLYVVPEARGQGIARRLIIEAERLGRQRGYREMGLTVAAHNDSARRLYESLGYRPERLYLTHLLD